MMFYKKKASILLWSIFLLTFLAFSFLYISRSISSQISKSNENNSIKYDFLNNTWDLLDDEKEELYKNFPSNFYTGVLRTWESITYTWIVGWVNFSFIAWWGAGFIYYSWTTSTWLQNTSFSIWDSWDLYIENRVWFVNYTISSTNNFSSPNREYMITKSLSWITILKNIWDK